VHDNGPYDSIVEAPPSLIWESSVTLWSFCMTFAAHVPDGSEDPEACHLLSGDALTLLVSHPPVSRILCEE